VTSSKDRFRSYVVASREIPNLATLGRNVARESTTVSDRTTAAEAFVEIDRAENREP